MAVEMAGGTALGNSKNDFHSPATTTTKFRLHFTCLDDVTQGYILKRLQSHAPSSNLNANGLSTWVVQLYTRGHVVFAESLGWGISSSEWPFQNTG